MLMPADLELPEPTRFAPSPWRRPVWRADRTSRTQWSLIGQALPDRDEERWIELRHAEPLNSCRSERSGLLIALPSRKSASKPRPHSTEPLVMNPQPMLLKAVSLLWLH